jgi:hypothetical protein
MDYAVYENSASVDIYASFILVHFDPPSLPVSRLKNQK